MTEARNRNSTESNETKQKRVSSMFAIVYLRRFQICLRVEFINIQYIGLSSVRV